MFILVYNNLRPYNILFLYKNYCNRMRAVTINAN